MALEKRGKSADKTALDMIKTADAEQKCVVYDFTGYEKYATGHDKPGIIVVATGDSADRLRKALNEILG